MVAMLTVPARWEMKDDGGGVGVDGMEEGGS